MSTVPTRRSSVTPSGICTNGALRTLVGGSPAWPPSRSVSPSCSPERPALWHTGSVTPQQKLPLPGVNALRLSRHRQAAYTALPEDAAPGKLCTFPPAAIAATHAGQQCQHAPPPFPPLSSWPVREQRRLQPLVSWTIAVGAGLSEQRGVAWQRRRASQLRGSSGSALHQLPSTTSIGGSSEWMPRAITDLAVPRLPIIATPPS